MSDPGGIHQAETRSESVSNTSGNVTILKFGDDVRDLAKKYAWLFPTALFLAFFIGVNAFATIWLAIVYQDDKHANATFMLLVYSEYGEAKAKLDALGIHLKPLPPPPQ